MTDDDRQRLVDTLNWEGAFCGQCGREPGDPIDDCPDCRTCLYGYADALAPVVDAIVNRRVADELRAIESVAYQSQNARVVVEHCRDRADSLDPDRKETVQ